MGLDSAAPVRGRAKPAGLLRKPHFAGCAAGSEWGTEQRAARGLPAGRGVAGTGTQGRKQRGQILAVPLFDKNNLGFRRKTLIQLLMKSEGGFGGSWCECLVQMIKAEEV